MQINTDGWRSVQEILSDSIRCGSPKSLHVYLLVSPWLHDDVPVSQSSVIFAVPFNLYIRQHIVIKPYISFLLYGTIKK